MKNLSRPLSVVFVSAAVFWALASAPASALAGPPASPARAPAGSSTQEPAGSQEALLPPVVSDPAGRAKSINFDDELVEGMNKNPLDVLTRVAPKTDRDSQHLYRIKTQFKRETRQTLREMGYAQ